jgi:hypothetical protein
MTAAGLPVVIDDGLLAVVIDDDLLIGLPDGHLHRGVMTRFQGRDPRAPERADEPDLAPCPPAHDGLHWQVVLGRAGGPLALVNDHPPLPEELRATLQKVVLLAEPGAALAVITRSRAGEASVQVCRATPAVGAREVAAGVAIFLASWGWDESESLRVTVDGVDLRVTPRFVGGVWQARVAPAAPRMTPGTD